MAGIHALHGIPAIYAAPNANRYFSFTVLSTIPSL